MSHSKTRSIMHGHALSLTWGDNRVSYEEWCQEEEITRPHVVGFQSMVKHLLQRAREVDSSKDQPYMPEPRTTLQQAVKHLSYYGVLGIHGGHMYWHPPQQTFSCSRIGGATPIHLSYAEAVCLLRANYMSEIR